MTTVTAVAACDGRRTAPPASAQTSSPRAIALGASSSAPFIGEGWFGPEGDHRWMGKHAVVTTGGPAAAGEQLHLMGFCPGSQVAAGSLGVTVSVDGRQVGEERIVKGEAGFDLAFPLPPDLVGKPKLTVAVDLERTFRPAGDARDLGLSIERIELR